MSQETSHIEETIADLEAWRDRISATIETLRYLSVQGAGLPLIPPPSSGRTGNGQDIPHDAFFQMTLPEAARKYLGIVKKTKPNPELATALVNGGLKSTSKNFPEMVRTVLSRDDRFVRVNSEWGLSEWYPAMRKEKKPKTGSEPQEPVVVAHDTAQKKLGAPSRAKKTQAQGSVKEQIVKFLDEHPEEMLGPAEIATRMNANPKTVTIYVGSLYHAGLIGKPQSGKYQSKRKS